VRARAAGDAPQERLQQRAARANTRAAAKAVALVVGQRRATVLAQWGALDADRRRLLLVRARWLGCEHDLVGERWGDAGRGIVLRGASIAGTTLHQGVATLPAVQGPSAMGCTTARATTGHTVLLHAQQALHLPQLGVAFLQHRCAAHEHVEAKMVSDGHLVGEASEVPVQLGYVFGERVASAA